ncbi:hypothetical protein C1M53_04945 [Mesorhizobium sp. Pch-S]|nr:hypothetical protein C1M53_04945 [Mesorhizobium sp. Pch-S]
MRVLDKMTGIVKGPPTSGKERRRKILPRGEARQELEFKGSERDLYRKPVPTFRDHADCRSVIFSENRFPLFGITLIVGA